MQVKKIEDKKIWEQFLRSREDALFVQSFEYGEFFNQMGEKAWIFGIYKNDNLIGGSLVVSTHAKRGNFLYLPYGPLLPKHETPAALRILIDFLKDFAKDNKYDFVRISPYIEENERNLTMFKNVGCIKSPMHVLAETTWLLSLKDNDDNLLAQMNKNHRNLIRRCEREGVTVKKNVDTESLELFNKMHDETAKRHKFHRFSKKYIENEFNSLSKNGHALVFTAYLPDGTLDSSAIIVYYNGVAAYRHGASFGKNKKLPTSYLLQWESIKEASKRGCKIYNFWGIAPESAPKNHPFKGITHFKKGFGGKQKDLLPCHDLPVSYRYWITWLIETFRKIKRGF